VTRQKKLKVSKCAKPDNFAPSIMQKSQKLLFRGVALRICVLLSSKFV
jgi:hypothetical protein